jgi:IMP dehydrogenase/GMP reductase
MNPLITNHLADGRYHERLAAADRDSVRTRALRSSRGDGVVELPALPGMGVRRPQWWAAFETADPARVPDACCD